MTITVTEFEQNLDKYLLLVKTEDIYITRNGHTIAILTSPYQTRVEIANSLIGILPPDIALEKSEDERLSKV